MPSRHEVSFRDSGYELAVGFEVVESGAQLGEQAGGGREVLLDARDVRVRGVVG